jgi:heme-degrading monooxygenase HmoA
MIAVIFEVRPRSGQEAAYLEKAAALARELEKIDGFISVERFESLTEPGKLLSLSFWEDEQAIARWRNHRKHRSAQEAGRQSIFSDYRLRIAAVIRDYGLHERAGAPSDSRAHHAGASG